MPYTLQIFSHYPTGDGNPLECSKHNVNIIQFPDGDLGGELKIRNRKRRLGFPM